ncbi:hypothetical protein [Acetobacter oeni]|uniref:hypothetical protein n=1 Tax=Acetobacter oeni TaxID=304077 RepID=UPI0017D30417|nr:hypothetical protein [Acetobacter oeni]MBB3884193.1 hypothetical protein [Acetobacter oeni]NHO20282.1 hypothetical protein [Acetobacter oeni]
MLRSVRFHVIERRVTDFRGADVLLTDLQGRIGETEDTKATESGSLLRGGMSTTCIPPKKNRKENPAYNWHLYKKEKSD